MNDKLKNAFIVLIVVVVIVGAGILGMAVGGFFKKSDEVVSVANGIVTDKDVSMKGASVLTTYEEYTKLLEEYDSSDVVLLTNNDFNESDYIVDYIYYDKDVEISNINLEVLDEGITIHYEVNKEPDKGDKYLIYFIPIEKGMLKEVKVNSRTFDVK